MKYLSLYLLLRPYSTRFPIILAVLASAGMYN